MNIYICTCIEIIVLEQVATRIHIPEDYKLQDEWEWLVA